MIVRDIVGADGTVHRVGRSAAFWDAFDDPDKPLGATGLLTVGCGLLLRTDPATQPQRTCPFCAAAVEHASHEVAAAG